MSEAGHCDETAQSPPGSLCLDCVHVRRITSARGSVFLLCQLALRDPRFAKYPPQPIARCSGYRQRDVDSYRATDGVGVRGAVGGKPRLTVC